MSQELRILIIFCIFVVAVVGIYYIYKIIERIVDRRRFKDNASEFSADLYMLQQKYNKKGLFHFAEILGVIIKATNGSIEDEETALTDYGRRVQRTLAEMAKEERNNK